MQRNNLLNVTSSKERVIKPGNADLKQDAQKIADLLEELDFDKMVKRGGSPDKSDAALHANNDKDKKRPNLNLFDINDHPLDLSFTKDINYGQRQGLTGYASDNDGGKNKGNKPN